MPQAGRILLMLGLAVCLLGPGRATAGGTDAVSPRRLVEIVDFSSPVASPDGGSVAFRTEQASVERNTHDTVWYVARMDGSAPPRRIADGGIPLRDSAGIPVQPKVLWSPDGRWIYYRALMDGRIDVWRAASDGSDAEPLTRDAADVRDFSLGSDGQAMIYSVGATREEIAATEQAEFDQGIRIGRSTPIGQNLFRSGFTEGRLRTQRLGLMFNRVGRADGARDRWKAVDLTTRQTRDLASEDAPGAPSDPSNVPGLSHVWKVARDREGGRVAVLIRTEEQTARPRVELAVLVGESLVRCLADACVGEEISGIQWRPDRDEVLFTVARYDEGFAQTVFGWDVTSGTVRQVVASSGMLAGEGRWSPGTCGASSAALACVTAEANRPPRLERIDLETGERQVLFDPNAALAQDLARIPARLLRWTDATGRRFTGQFYPARASGAPPPPLFINYYRCPGFVRGGAGDEWPLATLAEMGVSTLCINAPSFSAQAEERYGAATAAVESAIVYLESEGLIDRAKVGMGGLSFGAEVTMWTLIHSDLIAAASMASPTTSQQYYLLGSNIGEPFSTIMRENWQLGPPLETPDQWRRISAASNLDRIEAPILMQFSEQEYIHGLDYEIPLMLDQRADIYVFPQEPHNKFQPRHKLTAYERNLDWFRFWLQDHEDPDPGKAAQYRYWEGMRASTRERRDRGPST